MNTAREFLLDTQDGSDESLRRVLIACLIVAHVLSILRSVARWVKIRRVPFSAEDVFMYFGLISFTIMCSLYLSYFHKLHNIDKVAAGKMEPYASLEADVVIALKAFLIIEIFFWSTLWSVKLSLLCMYQKLVVGLSTYTRAWWAVMAFTILTFVGCVVSAFTSCSSMHAWFSAGDECFTPRDNIAKAASLWYSFAADLLTDLLVMVIPIHILYSIPISLTQKFSAGIVFTVGIITIIASIVRVVSLWLSIKEHMLTTLWSVIESGVAIVVGCLPSFAIFIRSRIGASQTQLFDTSPITLNKANTNIPLASPIAHARAESFRFEDDMEMVTDSSNVESAKSSVDRPSAVTQGESQRSHRRIAADTKRESSWYSA